MRLLGSLVTALALAACGGNVVVDDTGGSATGNGGAATGGSTSTVGVTTVSASAGGGGGPIGSACIPDGGPATFPSAYKACNQGSDCIVEPILDCCITYAVGVAQGQISAFEAYEASCEHLPLCQCMGPTISEDGKSGDLEVLCVAGSCQTSAL